ncbi:MAG: holo-ACP synthase [Planctomycetota bacterium]|nr:holo-ACP synthase [Planctomycetota bacterium]
MRIIGHGVDIVDTARIERMLREHGDRFLLRCFTEAELAYAADKKQRVQHLAGRFAAKEAVMKVIGTGWSQGVAWTDAEVVREPSGKPTVRMHGKGLEFAIAQGIDGWFLSISHIDTHAIASAIGVANEG